jgi:hypothetical protein
MGFVRKMSTRSMYLIGMLVLLFLANLAMLMGMTNWPSRTREGFADAAVKGKVMPKPGAPLLKAGIAKPKSGVEKFVDAVAGAATEDASGQKKAEAEKEGFMDFLQNGFGTASITPPGLSCGGQPWSDGTDLVSYYNLNNPVNQGFKQRTPNEPLAGPPVQLGPDNLFIFKNNQCKPECCGSSLACDGGCVCTTPEQRNLINSRGGNRGAGDI